MSRSRKHTPIMGNAARSEKRDKRENNRRLRRVVKHNPETDKVMKDVSDPWSMAKDGKQYFGDSKRLSAAEKERLMRK